MTTCHIDIKSVHVYARLPQKPDTTLDASTLLYVATSFNVQTIVVIQCICTSYHRDHNRQNGININILASSIVPRFRFNEIPLLAFM